MMNILFKDTNGSSEHLVFEDMTTIDEILKIYLRICTPPNILKDTINHFNIMFNASLLKLGDKTPAIVFFKNANNPKVIVHHPSIIWFYENIPTY